MWKNKNLSFLTIIILLFGYSSLYAQGKGQIKGVVTDSISHQVMGGVNVGLLGTSLGAATDLNGKYTINPVPVGTYTLIASYVGYKSYKTKVTVKRGQVLKLNIKLQQETIQGQEVVVSVQAEGQRQAINQQLQSDKIVNVVSQAKIQSLPDFNAAASIGRLPGVSTQKSSGEANKVVIRGMAPQYNAINVDGIRLSSTSSDRSVDLTMVSPYMIKTISVYKSLTPDMNGNVIGGTVNMELREAPKKPHLSMMWQEGYTQKDNSYGNYRGVLSGSKRFFHNKLGVYALVNAESYDRNADNLNAGYEIANTNINSETGYPPVRVTGVTLNRHIENKKRYGANLILDYKLPKGSIKAVNMFARIRSDYTNYDQFLNYKNTEMTWNLNHGIHVIDQQVNDLKFNYDLGFMTVDLSASYTSATNNLNNSPQFNFHQTGGTPIGNAVPPDTPPDSIYSNGNVTYLGNKPQGQLNDVLESVSLNTTDYKDAKFDYHANFKIPFNLGTSLGGFLKFGGQYNRRTITNDQANPNAALNGGVNSGGGSPSIQYLMMQGISNNFGLQPNNNGLFPMSEFVSTNQSLYDSFLGNKYAEFYYAAQAPMLYNIVNYIRSDSAFYARHASATQPGGWFDSQYEELANDYTYHNDYSAAYIMSKIKFHNGMIVGGVRYEKVKFDYNAWIAENARNPQSQYKDMLDTTATEGNSYMLPMVQMKYSPFHWMDIRYSYTQSLARVNFNQLSPKFTLGYTLDNVNAGNPKLKPARAYNQDFALTFHANKLGLLTIDAYYKKVKGFAYNASYRLNYATQEAGFDSLSHYQVTTHYVDKNTHKPGTTLISPDPSKRITASRPINNPYEATVKGIELDFQTNLWYLPHPLDGTVLGINYSHIKSETRYPYFPPERTIPGTRPPKLVFVDTSRTGRLIDQPNDILNAYIGYDYKGFSGRLSFSFQGNSVRSIASVPVADGFVKNYFEIDCSARQKLPFMGGELFLDISNLNNEKNVAAQPSINGVTSIQNYGMTANLGVRFRY